MEARPKPRARVARLKTPQTPPMKYLMLLILVEERPFTEI
jgi:hypothetical protein